MIEPLDARTLLSVAFKFNIIDPTGAYKSIRPQLQTLLNAAGGEWAQHLAVSQHDVTLEYDVTFDKAPQAGLYPQLASAAAKSGQVIGTDDGSPTQPGTGLPVYRLGTVTEMVTGKDPNGEKADGGIVIHGAYIKQFYFDPSLNERSAPIPAGMTDGYSAILHELAHSLGFVSTRDALGNVPAVGMYQFDQHVQFFGPGFYQFGKGTLTYDPTDPFGGGTVSADSDNAFKLYRTSVPLSVGDPNHLGVGRFLIDESRPNPGIALDFYLQNLSFQDDLSTDLMGGPILPGVRKTISPLDLAILKDSGTPINLNTDAAPEGIYTISGTGLPDKIDVSLANGTLLIRVNNGVTTFTPEQSQLISAIVINGMAGNDHVFVHGGAPAVAINGGAGNDTIIGGDKGDSITGSGGNDLIYGGKGGDVIRGGDGRDSLYGQGGSDRMFGDASTDHVDGGAQSDRLYGGGSADTLVGSTEDDFLYGEGGNDLLSGAGGKDRMDGGSGADAFYGGAGFDIVDYSTRTDGGITASLDGSADDGAPGELDNIVGADNVLGSPFADRIVGDENPNFLIGGGGNDTVDGTGGHDTLEGNGGNDVLSGGGGHDIVLGGDGADRLVGGTGRDSLDGQQGDDNLSSDDSGEIDTVHGGTGADAATADSVDELTAVETPTIRAFAHSGTTAAATRLAIAPVQHVAVRPDDEDALAGLNL
ncbi:MAG TPA: calcium-binding protein [Tepidisphaeraceae bacterium]|nr:calcium-binding protein [Tepidisphaeraceae bacterium]